MTPERLAALREDFRVAKATDEEIQGLIIGAVDYGEALDNVRAAMEQKATHYLIIADDVGDLYKYVKGLASIGIESAEKVITKLHENGNVVNP